MSDDSTPPDPSSGLKVRGVYSKSQDPETVGKMAFDKAKMAIRDRELSEGEYVEAYRELARQAEKAANGLQEVSSHD